MVKSANTGARRRKPIGLDPMKLAQRRKEARVRKERVAKGLPAEKPKAKRVPPPGIRRKAEPAAPPAISPIPEVVMIVAADAEKAKEAEAVVVVVEKKEEKKKIKQPAKKKKAPESVLANDGLVLSAKSDVTPVSMPPTAPKSVVKAKAGAVDAMLVEHAAPKKETEAEKKLREEKELDYADFKELVRESLKTMETTEVELKTIKDVTVASMHDTKTKVTRFLVGGFQQVMDDKGEPTPEEEFIIIGAASYKENTDEEGESSSGPSRGMVNSQMRAWAEEYTTGKPAKSPPMLVNDAAPPGVDYATFQVPQKILVRANLESDKTSFNNDRLVGKEFTNWDGIERLFAHLCFVVHPAPAASA